MEATQEQAPAMTVLEQCRISPAPGAVSPESLPLTFIDCIFMLTGDVQRVFFYELPLSIPHFLESQLPQLKISLSHALRDFRPLAGSLHLGSDGAKHEVRSSDLDTVPFTVAESEDDFHYLAGNHARQCARIHPLVPPLLPGTGAGQAPLALQVTLFPNAGVALGITVSHAVADGATTAHFLKTWAAACRMGKGGDPVGGAETTPSYDRRVLLEDPRGLEPIVRCFIDQVVGDPRITKLDIRGRKDTVLATFAFSREQIKRLGEEFTRKTGKAECSSFALLSGFMWACLVKAKGDSGGKTECFGFVFEARRRLNPPLPVAYFGNGIGTTNVEVGGSELEGEEGAIIAGEKIWKAVQDLKTKDAAEVTVDCIRVLVSTAYAGFLSVAGSPKLGMYQVDYGWGRPRKVEVISIERTTAMSMAEWGEDGRGVEIGLALPGDLMGRFAAIVAERLSETS